MDLHFENEVLYNPLHDQGYTSIGDQPLTTPTVADEELSGLALTRRWKKQETRALTDNTVNLSICLEAVVHFLIHSLI